MHDSTGKERGLMRRDPPQESVLSFDEMTLKVRRFRALRAEVMGTGVGPLPEHCCLGQQVDSAYSVHSHSHQRGLVPPETPGPDTLPSCLEKHSLTASLLPSEMR